MHSFRYSLWQSNERNIMHGHLIEVQNKPLKKYQVQISYFRYQIFDNVDDDDKELDIENALNKDIDEIKDTRLSIMYLEIKYYLCSKLLRDADWASMANSIELRTPFVDWSFFNKLIPLIKNDKSTNKEMAVNSMNDKLPKNIINRKKTGFVIPHNLYLQRLSFDKKYANPIRDWSILSYEKYLQKKTN